MTHEDAFADRRNANEAAYSSRSLRRNGARHRGGVDTDLRQLAYVLGMSDSTTLRVLRAAGYTAATVTLLDFMPLVLVAWSDGAMSRRERAAILEAASASQIEGQTPADNLLQEWLVECPFAPFCSMSLHALRVVTGALPPAERASKLRDLLGRCGVVASASRSVFGFGPTISRKERRAIEHITSTLERPPRW